MEYNIEEALKLFRRQHFIKEIKPNDKLQISFEKGRFTFRVSTELIYSLREFPKFDLSSNELAVTFHDIQFLTKIQSDDFRFLSKINITDFQNDEDRDLWNMLFNEGFSLNITPIFFSSTHELKDLFLRSLPFRLLSGIRFQFGARLSPEFNLHPLPNYFSSVENAKYNIKYNLLVSTPLLLQVLNCVSGSIHASLNSLNRIATDNPVIKKHLESLREQEEMVKDFGSMTLLIDSRFINALFSYGENQNVFDPPKHQFVISRTKELSNIQFGRLGERALYNYLKSEFRNAEAILQVFGYSSKSYLQLESNIIWVNENVESGKPFDIEFSFVCSIKSKDAYYYARNLFIDAKTTRISEESIFFFSLNEAEFMIQNYENYVIARISLLTKAGSYKGTKIHEEFYVNFYRPTHNLISIIRESLLEWKEHYNAPEVRFTIDHFELISKDLSELPF